MDYLNRYKEEFIKTEYNCIDYAKDVDHFINWLNIYSKNIQEITYNDFLKSINDLMAKGIIQRENTSDRYFEAIKAFYKFLKLNSYCNDIFERSTHMSDYKNYKKSLDFKPPKDKKNLTSQQIKTLLLNLEEFFKTTNYDALIKHNKKRKMNNYFKFLKLRLLIKITLLTPFKKEVISNIKSSNFKEKSRLLKYNNISLEMPNGFYHDLQQYKSFIKQYKENDFSKDERALHKEFLFGDNEKFYSYLGDELDKLVEYINKEYIKPKQSKIPYFSHETLRQSAIHNMIRSGVNIKIVSKLSGNDIPTLTQYYKKISNTIKFHELCVLKYSIYL